MANNSISTATNSSTQLIPTTITSTTIKRQKHNHNHRFQQQQKQQEEAEEEEEGGTSPLIAGLPDHIAQLCLSRLHPSVLFPICHSWRRLIYSSSFPPFPSLYAILSPHPPPPLTPPSLHHHNHPHPSSIQFSTFDPISSRWHPLPPPPPHPPFHHRHPSFLSRNLSIQSVSAAGTLVLLAGTTHNLFPALPRPVIFNPQKTTWSFGPTLSTPRRWCAAGTCRGAVYVASGIGTHFSIDVARSMEKWDTKENISQWEKKTALKDGRFSREAIDAVGYKGKLCMVNVKGDAAKEGVVYDVVEDVWKEMPEGMLAGWRGPVAAMDEEVMFVVDEVKGALRRYVEEEDAWEEVLEDERLKGAEQVSAEGGRVCVVSGGGGIFVVDIAAAQPRIWVVELPEGFEALAVHVLPRMPVTDFSTVNV